MGAAPLAGQWQWLLTLNHQEWRQQGALKTLCIPGFLSFISFGLEYHQSKGKNQYRGYLSLFSTGSEPNGYLSLDAPQFSNSK